ncbi:flagellar hook-basal body complex protein [Lacticigenium naphthae]|uniref:flagellar hook-basal body complex protein n=1 Tax=Lacticigenium naphthae TaxID=515351 RepID=UPI00040FE7CB|nr:flagellar hook-basal body complex protein [Lacticigenium naphthae]
MLKSMYSGVSGMKSFQTKMDVISNNIANVSTVGFKTGRVRFEDMISQINQTAQGPNNNGGGGVNTQQVGLGVQVGSTDTVMSGGSLQPTGRNLDFAIQNGDSSFFVVSKTGDGANVQFTRDGGFYADQDGNLVTASGARLMGYNTDPITGESLAVDAGVVTLSIPEDVDGEDIQNYTIDNTGLITATLADGNTATLGQVALASFANPDGLEKAGGNLYNNTANSGEVIYGLPSDAGYGVIRSGFLEMSNVDLANEFTEMITTSRAYQANSRSITTSDEMLQELINLKR